MSVNMVCWDRYLDKQMMLHSSECCDINNPVSVLRPKLCTDLNILFSVLIYSRVSWS